MLLLRVALLVLALAPLVYYLLSLYCVLDYFRSLRKKPLCRSALTPPVSILKPVRGADREAYENFASFCRLDYPEYEIVFATADPDDPAVPVIRKLQQDFPTCSIRLVTGVLNRGANNKVNNLCQLVREAKYDLVAISDSDVRVEQDYLREVVAPFANPEVGVVTTFYRGLSAEGFVSSMDAVAMYTDSAPAALVARKLERKMQFAFGWTMATTKNVLCGIGGFESMVNHHSDDFELGNRVSRLGLRVELMRTPVWMVFPKETLSEHFRHELRWSIGLRNVRPTGYLGMLFTHGLPWALFAAFVAFTAGWTSTAAAYLLAYSVLRLGVVWITGAWGFGDRKTARQLYLVPLRDALSFATWFAGLFLDKIVWRGLSYHVRKGLLVPIQDRKLAH
ncbi:MAG TPA: bacteriohopanetetrol glucosamine biosynthesis glycosyltransferase HpnI [Candidatus Methylomirabilis sp.]|nr:bacteriohopanetetrol glucosamine biosynthesis glycosyltransferase HpnI [Candidatus Methylomirabilis sp.]